MTKLTAKQKQELDDFINYSVKEGILDPDVVDKWNYLKKLDWFNWSEAYANDNERDE